MDEEPDAEAAFGCLAIAMFLLAFWMVVLILVLE